MQFIHCDWLIEQVNFASRLNKICKLHTAVVVGSFAGVVTGGRVPVTFTLIGTGVDKVAAFIAGDRVGQGYGPWNKSKKTVINYSLLNIKLLLQRIENHYFGSYRLSFSSILFFLDKPLCLVKRNVFNDFTRFRITGNCSCARVTSRLTY